MKKHPFVAQMEAAQQRKRKSAMRVIWVTVAVLAALLIALSIALIIDLAGMKIRYTLEAGEALPDAEALSGKNGAVFDSTVENMDLSVPGYYEFYVLAGEKKILVELTVEDTKAPVGELLRLRAHQGGRLPNALDFFANVTDASSFDAKFRNSINPTELGIYKVELELYDEYGNSRKCASELEIIIDTEAPIFTKLPKVVYFGLYDTIAYRTLVEVSDNCFGVELSFDSSAVNNEAEGTYTVTYTATDSAGLSASATVEIVIVKEMVSAEQLNAKLESIASTFVYQKKKMKEYANDKVMLCRAIYKYVNDPLITNGKDARIEFEDTFSYTRHGDWRKEAYDALCDKNPRGDCFTYYAVAKAFFEYFGIENIDIERTAGVRTDGTHFWSLVNIGTEKKPQWYYFDATRLNTKHMEGSGCLFTENQRQAYNNINQNFLHCDTTKLPQTETTVINKNFVW